HVKEQEITHAHLVLTVDQIFRLPETAATVLRLLLRLSLWNDNFMAVKGQTRVSAAVCRVKDTNKHAVKAFGGYPERRVILGDSVLLANSYFIEEHDAFAFSTLPMCSLTVASRLVVLRRKVDAPADAAATVGHNSQASLQDGSHDSHIGPMPEQLAVAYLFIDIKPIGLEGKIGEVSF
ncbi:hypothetical protein EGW08_015505, partial [Elysia chlorotica]